MVAMVMMALLMTLLNPRTNPPGTLALGSYLDEVVSILIGAVTKTQVSEA